MHIFENGAVFINSNNGDEIKCSVLVADIFEKNIDMKAMIVIDTDENDYDFTDPRKTVDIMECLSKCDVFKCEATELGNVFECTFRDVVVDPNYGSGSIIRVFIHIEEFEHQECRVISNNYDNIIDIISSY